MNIKEIKEMINLMNENGLVELEVEKEDKRIRLKKTASGFEGMNGPIAIERQGVVPTVANIKAVAEAEVTVARATTVEPPMVVAAGKVQVVLKTFNPLSLTTGT